MVTISDFPTKEISPSEFEKLKKQLPDTRQEECEKKGGTWDAASETCIMPEPEPEPKPPLVPETFTDVKTGRPTGVTLESGETFFGLNTEEIQELVSKKAAQTAQPAGTAPFGTTEAVAAQQAESARLAGQVGQVQAPTDITAFQPDQGEATRQAIAGAIPRALGLAVAGGAAGLVKGGAAGSIIPGAGTAAGAGYGAAIGAVAGLSSGIAQGIISNRKSQRSDNAAAQLRTLTDGKQALSKWVALARSDPANARKYAAEFNLDLQEIENAHVQLLTDTNADVNKFETSITELAEFNVFYDGERQGLVAEMQVAVQTQASPEYEMLLLAQGITQ